MSAVLSREPDRSFPVETNGGRDISATKVDRTIALVGRPVGDQLLCERDDLVDVVTAAGFETGSSNAQGRHVALEPIGLLCCQRPPRFAITGGLNEKMVVDVSHVPTHVDCCSGQSQNARRDVGPHEGRRVADMSRLVRRDAAHVDASRAQKGHAPAPDTPDLHNVLPLLLDQCHGVPRAFLP